MVAIADTVSLGQDVTREFEMRRKDKGRFVMQRVEGINDVRQDFIVVVGSCRQVGDGFYICQGKSCSLKEVKDGQT